MTVAEKEMLVAEVTTRVVENIRRDYFLTPKTFNLNFTRENNLKIKEFIENIIYHTCSHFDMTKEKFLSRNKGRFNEFITYPEIRYLAMNLCRSLAEDPISYEVIGEYFNRDYASIIHAIKRIPVLRGYREFELHYKQIEKKVNESLRLQ